MDIAPKVSAKHWLALNLSLYDEQDWPEAIDIFKSRMYSRYIDPVDLLISEDQKKLPQDRIYGFTVMAIDCLLIETIQSFIEGKADTRGESKQIFKRFLTQRIAFKQFFNDESAENFFERIRCGILHQAEIRNSIVWSIGPLISINNDEIKINRTEFHLQLKTEFERYLQELRDGFSDELRENFVKKMKFICEGSFTP